LLRRDCVEFANGKFASSNELPIAIITTPLVDRRVSCDFSVYPNIKRWLENMKSLKSWAQVNEVFNGFVAANKRKELVRV